jgi:iron complex outermembrane receptor protein
VKANARHSVSASYDFNDRYQVRGGINNFTNRQVSFPTFNYGDLIGRQWFVGFRMSYLRPGDLAGTAPWLRSFPQT